MTDRTACTGAGRCVAPIHIHGCYADRDGARCDEPQEHRVSTKPSVDEIRETAELLESLAAALGDKYLDGTDEHIALTESALFFRRLIGDSEGEPQVRDMREFRHMLRGRNDAQVG